jgi:hypothetical protein
VSSVSWLIVQTKTRSEKSASVVTGEGEVFEGGELRACRDWNDWRLDFGRRDSSFFGLAKIRHKSLRIARKAQDAR